MKVLIVDDDKDALESLAALLELAGHDYVGAGSGEEGLEAFNDSFACVLLDLGLPGIDGFTVLQEILKKNPFTTVVVISATNRAKETVRALKGGAFDFIAKPYDSEDIFRCLEAVSKKNIREGDPQKLQIICASQVMKKLCDQILQVAPTKANVLIEGESGTGKELVARAIHENSENANQPFYAINCAAIPTHLFESELFGYERGAFTGAHNGKAGKLEFAGKGTFFFDEVNSLTVENQKKLLRVLEERCFQRVGGRKDIPFEARVVAASNADLRKMVEEGEFRQDMFFRLNVVSLLIPPLRQRSEDVKPLSEHFVREFSRLHKKNVTRIEPDTQFVLSHFPWPGNVRELRNIIERAVIFTPDGEMVSKQYIAEPLLLDGDENGGDAPGLRPLNEEMKVQERRYLSTCLDHFDWNVAKTAKVLGVHRNTLFNKISSYSLHREESVVN